MIDAAPSLVVFERRAGGLTAMLGVWAIGEVLFPSGGARASWRLNLIGAPPYYRYAPTVEAAQERLAKAAMEWIDAAGLAPALPIDGVIRSSPPTNGNGNGERNRA